MYTVTPLLATVTMKITHTFNAMQNTLPHFTSSHCYIHSVYTRVLITHMPSNSHCLPPLPLFSTPLMCSHTSPTPFINNHHFHLLSLLFPPQLTHYMRQCFKNTTPCHIIFAQASPRVIYGYLMSHARISFPGEASNCVAPPKKRVVTKWFSFGGYKLEREN